MKSVMGAHHGMSVSHNFRIKQNEVKSSHTAMKKIRCYKNLPKRLKQRFKIITTRQEVEWCGDTLDVDEVIRTGAICHTILHIL